MVIEAEMTINGDSIKRATGFMTHICVNSPNQSINQNVHTQCGDGLGTHIYVNSPLFQAHTEVRFSRNVTFFGAKSENNFVVRVVV